MQLINAVELAGIFPVDVEADSSARMLCSRGELHLKVRSVDEHILNAVVQLVGAEEVPYPFHSKQVFVGNGYAIGGFSVQSP